MAGHRMSIWFGMVGFPRVSKAKEQSEGGEQFFALLIIGDASMRKLITVDELYRIAGEIYEDDYMAEAIVLYRSAMLRKEPTPYHFTLLSEAERIEKMQFLGKLKDKYPDSDIIKLEFAKSRGLHHATKVQTELLNQADLAEVTERSLRHQRFVTNCKLGRNIEPQYLYEDFLYLWNAKQNEKATSFRLVLLKYLLSGHGMQKSEVIPILERLMDSADLDAEQNP
jgi:hypothetical protein